MKPTARILLSPFCLTLLLFALPLAGCNKGSSAEAPTSDAEVLVAPPKEGPENSKAAVAPKTDEAAPAAPEPSDANKPVDVPDPSGD